MPPPSLLQGATMGLNQSQAAFFHASVHDFKACCLLGHLHACLGVSTCLFLSHQCMALTLCIAFWGEGQRPHGGTGPTESRVKKASLPMALLRGGKLFPPQHVPSSAGRVAGEGSRTRPPPRLPPSSLTTSLGGMKKLCSIKPAGKTAQRGV